MKQWVHILARTTSSTIQNKVSIQHVMSENEKKKTLYANESE